MTEPLDALRARVDAARRRVRARPVRETAHVLAAAARLWRDDPALRAGLPAATWLSRPMIDAVVPLVAAALDEAAMIELVERELGPSPGRGPALVAHVLASNVPGLAVPAIALACLAGAAVVVKSGRDDILSAPAFVRALDAVDPGLAATVVATYWPGGDRAREDVVFPDADVVVATGGDAAVAALRTRVRGRFVAHGPRVSLVAVDGDADIDAIARDVALYDQRGCLSPHAVYTTGDARALALGLAAALDRLGTTLPPGEATVAERAAAGVARAGAEWDGCERIGGGVLHDPRAEFRASPGGRTIRVQPLRRLADLPALLPRGTIECVGLAGAAPASFFDALRAAGVARVCPPGRMQRPPLSWPRGQRAPLGSLVDRAGEPRLAIET